MIRFRLKCLRCKKCNDFLCRSDGQMCWKFSTTRSVRAYGICYTCRHRDNCVPDDPTVGNGNNEEPWNNANTVYGGRVNVNHDPLVECQVCHNSGVCSVTGKMCILIQINRNWLCMFCRHKEECYFTMTTRPFIKFGVFIFFFFFVCFCYGL